MVPGVLLVGGPGGAGASTTAARIADQLAATGRGVTVLDDDPYDGATARCREPAVLGPTAHRTQHLGAEQVLEVLGGTADLIEPLRHTLTAASLKLLWSIPLDLPAGHLVVIDSGASAPELARLARTLPAVLLRLSRLGSGWLRTSRPLLAAIGGRRSGPAVLAELQSAAQRARGIRNALCGVSGGALLVAGETSKTARLGVGVGLCGVRVRAVSGLTDDSRDVLPGVPRLASQDLLACLDQAGEAPLQIHPDDETEGYRMRMSLPLSNFRHLKLRWSGHSLTLAACGHESLLELPSALQRCHPSGARLRDGMLDVAFRPNPAGA